MKTYNIRGQDIFIPEQGDIQWGADVTEAFGKIATGINVSQTEGYIGPFDVKDYEVSGLVEDGTWNDIDGLVFDKNQVRAAIVEMMVLRSGGSQKDCAVVTANVTYDENTNNWYTSIEHSGNTEVEFDINSNGQFQYSAQNVGSTMFKIRYRGRAMGL